MPIKREYYIKPILAQECTEWLLYKHYAHRLCPISFSFGLFRKEVLVGCCVFGRSANRNNNSSGEFQIMELNRLVVNDGLERNVLSFFVASCLKKLPPPMIILSYADPEMGHHGYIYQATNWIYLGQGQRRDGGWDSGVTQFEKDGKRYHAKTVSGLIGGASASLATRMGYKRLFLPPKHKYCYLIGNKQQKKEMMCALGYKSMPYPKGDNKRYDASYSPPTQQLLF